MMKRGILIFAALAAWTACAQSARLGALGRNDMVVTNVSHLLPRVYSSYGETVTLQFEEGPSGLTFKPSSMWVPEAFIDALWIISASTNGPLSAIGQYGGAFSNARAEMEAHVSAATNALAQTIPQGGGTPEWRVDEQDLTFDPLVFVTNGIVEADCNNPTDPISANLTGWPDGAAMFVRMTTYGFPYTVGPPIRLVGYGTWPTNDFQSVWWRSGTNIFVNILVEGR